MLSEKLGAGVFDWSDIMPFYQKKLENFGAPHATDTAKPDMIRQLFQLTFPEVDEWPIETILKMLSDKRIVNLRETISSVVDRGEEIDSEYVVRMLKEVITVEQTVARNSKVISYMTAPLGFIPIVGAAVQKVQRKLGLH